MQDWSLLKIPLFGIAPGCGFRIFKITLDRIFDDSSAIVAGITTMVDEPKTIVEDTLPSAKKQKQWSKTQNRWRRDKNIGESTMPLVKR
jgi:hypothetical protein